MTKRDIQRLLVFIAVFGAISALTSCDMVTSWIDGGAEGEGGGGGGNGSPQSGQARFQGTLEPLVVGESGRIVGARSLASAIVNVAALPVVTGELNVEAVESTSVDDDGAFEVDVDVQVDDPYVFLVVAPEEGVGLEQSLGWIELPIEDERSTGWPIESVDDGAILDLGSLSATDDGFVPGTDEATLYDILGADLAELLFSAQRDNALKILSNDYLNAEADLQYWTNQYITAKVNDAKNAWTTASTVVDADDGGGYFGYYYGVNFDSDVYTWSDFDGGANEFVLYPPDTVTPQNSPGQTFGPNDPLGSDLYWPNGGAPDNDLINGVGFVGPPVSGFWRLEINGTLDGVYDLSFSSLFDQNGNFLYFLPSFRINCDVDDRIESFEFRFLMWDFAAAEFEELPLEDMPLFWTVSYQAKEDGTSFDESIDELLDLSDGTAVPSSEIFFPVSATGYSGFQLWDLALAYTIGPLTVNIIFQPDYDTL